MNLMTLLSSYEDGDQHGWETEFTWLYVNRAERLNELRRLIQKDGITEPVLLGPDGRVWDGHHRLCLAAELGINNVPVEYA